MVMHGFNSTVHATVPMMATHIAAVRRGAPDKFIVGDMPFLAARRERGEVLDAVRADAGGLATRSKLKALRVNSIPSPMWWNLVCR